MGGLLFRSLWFRRIGIALGVTLIFGFLYFDALTAIIPALLNVSAAQERLAFLSGADYWREVEALGINRNFWLAFVALGYAVVAFGITLLAGLAIISQFVLPLQTMPERQQVLRHFLRFASEHFFGQSHGPIIFVRDGRLVARRGEEKQQGHGVAVVDAVSAVVIERTASPEDKEPEPPLVRAAGPGITFITPGERIVAALDLRRQSRRATAKALTRDGLEVSATVSVTFGLDPDRDRPPPPPEPSTPHDEPVERNRPAYTFNPVSAFRAVYGAALGEQQAVEWTDLPVAVAVERFRDLLSERTLDELFQPTVPSVYPFGEFQATVTNAVRESPVLRERGICVISVGIGRFTLPREVVNERVRRWRVGWQKAAYQRVAAGDRHAINRRGDWRAQSQEEIIRFLRDRLRARPGQSQEALALTLNKALQEAARDPTTRKLLPKEILDTLQAMQNWLPKEPSP